MTKTKSTMYSPLPPFAKRAVSILEKAGYEAFAVGGCVRDMLMGKAPNDYDITTNALPSAVKQVFGGHTVLETGIAHGTVTVLIEGNPIEITTYRIDGEYLDGRRPKAVQFTSSLREDLARRDFTINALAYNRNNGLVDFFGGKEDIEKGLIRCVGNATDRFNEDGLRILRCLRFASVLEFTIEENTAAAAISCKRLLEKISAERNFAEIKRALCGKGIEPVFVSFFDIFTQIIPQLKNADKNAVAKRLSAVPSRTEPRLAALLEPCKKEAEAVLTMLKAENRTKARVKLLLNEPPPSTRAQTKHLLNKAGEDGALDVLQFNGKDTAILKDILKSGECYNMKMLNISGNTLLKLGFGGAQIGIIKERLLEKVFESGVENTEAALLECVKNMEEQNA